MVEMEDKMVIVIRVLFSIYLTVGILGMIKSFQNQEPEYAVVEDNAVETVISIKQGDDMTLLNLNRYEDDGGLWEVTYDGKGEPKARKVQNAKD